MFNRIVSISPDLSVGYYYLGQIFLQRKNTQKSLEQFKKALERNPMSTRAIGNIVGIHMVQDNPAKALSFCKSKLEEHDDKQIRAFIHSRKAMVHVQQKELDKAKAAYKEAINEQPEWTLPYIRLANIYSNQGNIEKAISRYEEVHSKNPEYIPALMNLGMLYEENQELDKANEYYQKCLDINQKFAPAANNLAYLLVEQGEDLNQALSLAQTAKEQNPNDPGISDTLGWIYVQKGAYQSAIAQFKDALKKMPDNPSIQYHLGVAYHKKDKNELALKHLKLALDSEQEFKEEDRARELMSKLEQMETANK